MGGRAAAGERRRAPDKRAYRSWDVHVAGRAGGRRASRVPRAACLGAAAGEPLEWDVRRTRSGRSRAPGALDTWPSLVHTAAEASATRRTTSRRATVATRMCRGSCFAAKASRSASTFCTAPQSTAPRQRSAFPFGTRPNSHTSDIEPRTSNRSSIGSAWRHARFRGAGSGDQRSQAATQVAIRRWTIAGRRSMQHYRGSTTEDTVARWWIARWVIAQQRATEVRGGVHRHERQTEHRGGHVQERRASIGGPRNAPAGLAQARGGGGNRRSQTAGHQSLAEGREVSGRGVQEPGAGSAQVAPSRIGVCTAGWERMSRGAAPSEWAKRTSRPSQGASSDDLDALAHSLCLWAGDRPSSAATSRSGSPRRCRRVGGSRRTACHLKPSVSAPWGAVWAGHGVRGRCGLWFRGWEGRGSCQMLGRAISPRPAPIAPNMGRVARSEISRRKRRSGRTATIAAASSHRPSSGRDPSTNGSAITLTTIAPRGSWMTSTIASRGSWSRRSPVRGRPPGPRRRTSVRWRRRPRRRRSSRRSPVPRRPRPRPSTRSSRSAGPCSSTNRRSRKRRSFFWPRRSARAPLPGAPRVNSAHAQLSPGDRRSRIHHARTPSGWRSRAAAPVPQSFSPAPLASPARCPYPMPPRRSFGVHACSFRACVVRAGFRSDRSAYARGPCVRACVRSSARARVRACARACERACARLRPGDRQAAEGHRLRPAGVGPPEDRQSVGVHREGRPESLEGPVEHRRRRSVVARRRHGQRRQRGPLGGRRTAVAGR